MRLTLSNVMTPLANAINQNTYSARCIDYINRGQEELLNYGRWVGTRVRYRVCSDGGFVVWPRAIGSVEAMRICGFPVILHNEWFEFQDFTTSNYSYGAYGIDSQGWLGGVGPAIAIDQQEVISFAELCGSGNPKRLKVYAFSNEAAGARILFQGYDANGQWIRTNDVTEGWTDGEFVSINAAGPQTTINTFTSWVGVQKPVTNNRIMVTELDTVTALERTLANYESDETSPSYRRNKIPSLFCNQFANAQIPRSVPIEVIGKQRFIPATTPRSYLMLSSASAIVQMAIAIYRRENGDVVGGEEYEQKAVQILDNELSSWIGQGTMQVPILHLATGMGSGVSNMI